jgi:hypothetical protein
MTTTLVVELVKGGAPLWPRIEDDTLAEGYRLDDDGRQQLAGLLARRIISMYDLLREGHRSRAQPWALLWDQGHGDVWLADATYTERHGAALRAALTGPS